MSGDEQITYRGCLRGHEGWVTSLATTQEDPNLLLSSSRDRTVLVWQLTGAGGGSAGFGFPRRALRGHSHFVSDVTISHDGQFALSGSWDGTLRLWDINTGKTTRRFVGHDKDVLSVAFSVDNRQIVSASRDRTIKLWNTLGECKFTITKDQHTEWASCVRFSPAGRDPTIVSCGWDKVVKVWKINTCELQQNLLGHTGYLNTVTVSPDGSLCASGGKDGVAMLWDLQEGKELYELRAGEIIHALVFSPNRYWLCAATGNKIIVWDLESKANICELEIAKVNKEGEIIEPAEGEAAKPSKGTPPYCTCLCWSADGQTLFAGCTDNLIRVYQVN